MISHTHQKRPAIRRASRKKGLQDRTIIFVSPTDLSNLVAGLKNSDPVLIREIEICTLALMKGLETRLKENAIEMKLSSGLNTLNSLQFLRKPIVKPLLVAMAETSGRYDSCFTRLI